MSKLRLAKNADMHKRGNFKTKKRIMRSFSMGEISAVDKPAQAGATISLMKRAPGSPPDPQLALAKKTFQEALNAQLISEQVSETFWRAFENQWAVRDAFRTALVDEISEGGDGSTATAAFTDAMRTLATLASDAAREAAQSNTTPDLASAVETAVEKWLMQHEEQTMHKYQTVAALKAAIATFAKSGGTDAEIDAIRKSAAALGTEGEATLPATGALAKSVDLSGQLAVITKRLQVSELTDEVRKHYVGLPADQQDAFLAKSATDQLTEARKAAEGDPVVYTAKDGTTVRKSDGSVALLMAKNFDALNARLDKVEASTVENSLEKRAADFPHVPTEMAFTMLKAADDETDAEKKKAKLDALAAANKAFGPAFKRMGHSGAATATADFAKGSSIDASGVTLSKAETDLNELAKKYAEENKVSLGKAMLAVTDTDEGKALYNEIVGFTPGQ